MSSILSGIGIASGLDIAGIIQQLLAAEGQRRTPLQTRIAQIAQTRAALQQTSSLLLSLRSTATALAAPSTLSASTLNISAPTSLAATITNPSSVAFGTTSLLIRSLASASRVTSSSLGSTSTPLGIDGITLRFGGGQLVDDRPLALLNGGLGVPPGRIRITDRAGKQATIDLRDALTIDDVTRAINDAEGLAVEARLRSDGRGIELIATAAGGSTLKVQEFGGGTTAAALGVLGSDSDGDGTMVGSTIAQLGAQTPLSSLGGGVPITDGAPDFMITVGAKTVPVDLGAHPSGAPPRAATLGEALARIDAALASAGVANDVSITIAPTGDRLRVTALGSETITITLPSGVASSDGGVIAALGLPSMVLPADHPSAPPAPPGSGNSVDGDRILFGMHDVALARLDGGIGLDLTGDLTITDRAGRTATALNLGEVDSVQMLLDRINTAVAATPGMKVEVSFDASGTRLRVVDLASGSGALAVSGAAAAALGFSPVSMPDATSGVLQSRDLARATIGRGTPLASLTGGSNTSGVFTIKTASGASVAIAVTAGMTVADLSHAVAESGVPAALRINALGDALEIIDESGATGTLTVTDTSGGVASALRLTGTSTNGRIDGTRTVKLDLNGTESATQIAAMLDALAGVDAQVIENDPDGPFLMVTASATGLRNGISMSLDGADLGWTSVTAARDARVLMAPESNSGGLVTSESNSIGGVLPGITLELLAASDEIISLTSSPSVAPIASSVKSFAAALASALAQLRSSTAVDVETGTRGSLYGNATAARARDALRSLVSSTFGPDGRRLSSLGISISNDGSVTVDEAKLSAAFAADADGVRETLAGAGGLAPRIESLLAAFVDPTQGTFNADDARLERITSNTNARIDRIDQALLRRRDILLARFTAMETTIERLRWQQSTLQSLISGLGSSS